MSNNAPVSEEVIEYIPVVMVRPHLRDIPRFPLPAGYSWRMFREGDEQTWLRVWRESETLRPGDISPRTFQSNFGADLAAMPRRCFFVLDPSGREVATTTAWYDRAYRGQPWGRIHWVAVTPSHRRLGLSHSLLTLALERMVSLGHRRAVLTTQSPRLPAIRAYLRFGFVPDMTYSRAEAGWRVVAEHIDHPAIRQALATV